MMPKLDRDRLESVFEPYLEAESGDWRRFADMIEQGEPLPPPARRMIAEHLRGNSPAPKRRKRAQQRLEAQVCFQFFELISDGLSRSDAIRRVVSDTPGLTEDAVGNYLKNWKNDR